MRRPGSTVFLALICVVFWVSTALCSTATSGRLPILSLKSHRWTNLRRIHADSDTSRRLHYPIKPDDGLNQTHNSIGLQNPMNVIRRVDYDPLTQMYIVSETLGGRPYRMAQYLTFKEYARYQLAEGKKLYWMQKSGSSVLAKNRGLIPRLTVNSQLFERLFGGNTIDIRPQGEAELDFGYRFNRNDNPLFTQRQRTQGSFDFQERIQMNLTGNIGDKLKVLTLYNTESQFDFENQIKLEYTGRQDEIIRKIELGNVSMPLPTQLITGTQNLFGIKTQLQFGRLGVTTIFSQQKSQRKQININNGTQQNDFRLTADAYDANRHYFLAQFFRNNYNRSLQNLPIVNSSVVITRIEVWVTNRRTDLNNNARDVIGFLDLAETNPYNPKFTGNSAAPYPNSKRDPVFSTKPSNNLLDVIPADSRLTNSTSLYTYFQASGASDNYAKVTYARRLDPTEFTLHPTLGFISLNQALNADEILTVAYQYVVNGRQYQVGELSTDIPVDAVHPGVLFTKMLKNAVTRVTLPTWKLMMKNVYALGAYQINPTNFIFNVTRLDEKSGVDQLVMTEGINTSSKRWLQLVNLDNMNAQQDRVPDGQFDFIQNITIDPANGWIIFPVLEPFGSDLASRFAPGETLLKQKYVYQQLYDSTRFQAQQFPALNRYILKGTYQSTNTNEFNLNAFNIPQGSVKVVAGNIPLVEGQDYTVDYSLGKVRIINEALLNAGIPITINVEDNSLFGVQQRSLMGTRLDYIVNNDFRLGATLMNLSEKPLTQKVSFGNESINNTEWGLDGSYRGTSRWLTRMINNLPFIQQSHTVSTFSLSGEFAQLIPGHNKALDFGGDRGVSYIDDFENTSSIIDLRSSTGWYISGTPQRFTESALIDNVSYGFNRALLSFYNIDPIFYSIGNSQTPANIQNNTSELSDHRVRQVSEQEIFPAKPVIDGQPSITNTLNLAYYPMVRGPYNYDVNGADPTGKLLNPTQRWGGIFRGLQSTDFESLNVEYIEMWVMDPFLANPRSRGGNLYFDLGSISEDILKDGRKSLENALPSNGSGIPGVNSAGRGASDTTGVDTTAWGAVSRRQPVTQSFDNDPAARPNQDVGLDGMSDANEQIFFKGFLNRAGSVVASPNITSLRNDPSSDDFHYYTGGDLDQANAGIMKRYQAFNGMDGNSRTTTGLVTTASTSLPDQEDVNRDNNMSTDESYFEYRVAINKDSMFVGKNNIVAIQTTNTKLANGSTVPVKWYQIKVPVRNPIANIGGIEDFKTIRFIRMYMTNFQDTTVLRFGRLQLLRGEWRKFNEENSALKVIKDQAVPTSAIDASQTDVTAISIEENSTSRPNGIQYVIPPGIAQEQNLNSYQQNLRLNEQSLVFNFTSVADGFSRFSYKILGGIDSRKYKRIKMFIHLENSQNPGRATLQPGDIHAVVRLGADYIQNYYEVDIPLLVTQPNAGTNQDLIWPISNNFDIALQTLKDAKLARNKALLSGAPWPVNVVFEYRDPSNRKNIIRVLGNPDLSNIRVGMLGLRNPFKGSNSSDDGLPKSGEIWFDELRFTDFDEGGGWAATGRMNAKLADLANVTVTGFHSTAGFGTLESKINELNKFGETSYDIATNVDLSKFFKAKAGLNIPMFFYYSHDRITPQYDPNNPDVKLNDEARSFSSRHNRDSVLNAALEIDTRKSLNFSNVRKLRTDPTKRAHFWDIENISLTYAYNANTQHNYLVENFYTKTYKGVFDYSFQATPKNYRPFKKIMKSKWLDFLRDLNFTPLPTAYNFRLDIDRFNSFNQLRANVGNGFFQAPPAYNRTFYLTRNYGIHWDLTKSMHVDFTATNYSTIDEPAGAANARTRDSVRTNLMRGGRTTDYTQNVTITYNVPLNKFRYLDFITLQAKYGAYYEWRSASLAVLKSDTAKLGNAIQNQRQFELDPAIDMNTLYSKFKWLKRITAPRLIIKNPKDTAGKHFKYVNPFVHVLGNLMTSIKSIRGSYTLSQGIFLPGFLPQPTLLGNSLSAGGGLGGGAPGYGFIFGSQRDITTKAGARGWVTPYKYLQAQFIRTYHQSINAQVSVEPIKDLRIELTGIKDYLYSHQATFKFDSASNGFVSQNPITSGTYSISVLTIKSAFETQGGGLSSQTSTFQKFQSNRLTVSRRLAAGNPFSKGVDSAGYSSGYGGYSQDVLISSFLAAYTGVSASKVKTELFRSVPSPGWRLTYNGLVKLPYLRDVFTSLLVSHAYRSVYTLSSFTSSLSYSTNIAARDESNNFFSKYQVSYLNITENFDPLIGLDVRFKNNVTANIQYSKSRTISLSLSNGQLAEIFNKEIVFGAGYHAINFRLPFRVNGETVILKNDLNFKLDFAIRDSKSLIYQLDVPDGTVAGGLKNVSIRPAVDYNFSKQFNFRIYYDSNSTKPYTSNAYNSSFSTLGVSLRYIIGG